MTITHSEAKRIVLGNIPSMSNVERFFKQLSGTFYEIGKKIQSAVDSHREWLKTHSLESIPTSIPAELGVFEEKEQHPFPFHTFKLIPREDVHPAYRYLSGRTVVSDALTDGVYNTIAAFCFQFADEFFDHNLISDMDYRKELKKRIQSMEQL